MTDLSTHAGQVAHYADVRARLLRGRDSAPSLSAPRSGEVRQPLGAPSRLQEYTPTPFGFLAPPGWRHLVKFCALAHGVAAADITGPTRLRNVVSARHHAVALCVSHTSLSGSEIGRRFGRDHSTVIHSVKMWAALNNVSVGTGSPKRLGAGSAAADGQSAGAEL